MPKKRIVIVEDERDMAELVAMRLRKEGFHVDQAHDGARGLEMIRTSPPDLVLLDVMLPGMNGTEVAAAVRGDPRTAEVPIIMLTARGEESDVVVGLKLGADDYVTKPFSMSVLMARIDALLRRTGPPRDSSKGILTTGPISIDPHRHRVQVDSKTVELTLTEFKLLAALAAARGRILTRNQLMDQAMGVDVVVTDRTVDVHITSLRKKLGRARDYVQTVRGVGFKLEAPEEIGTSREDS